MGDTWGGRAACASELSALTSSVETVRFSFSACHIRKAVAILGNGAIPACQMRHLPNKEGALPLAK